MTRILATVALLVAAALVPTSHALAQSCSRTTGTSDLQASLDAAESAFGRVDVDAFDSAMTEVREIVPCLDEVVSAGLVAQLHRMEGLAAFVAQSEDRAVVAFAAARSLEPSYTFPSAVVPPGNPVLDRYLQRDASCPAEPIPPAADGEVRLDSRPTGVRPTEFPAVLQVVDAGRPTVTRYLWPDDALPYEAGRAPATSSKGLRIGLLAGGSTVAALGLGSLIAGAATGPRADDDLDTAFAKSARNDTLAGVGAALMAVGGAGVGVSFVLPSRN